MKKLLPSKVKIRLFLWSVVWGMPYFVLVLLFASLATRGVSFLELITWTPTKGTVQILLCGCALSPIVLGDFLGDKIMEHNIATLKRGNIFFHCYKIMKLIKLSFKAQTHIL